MSFLGMIPALLVLLAMLAFTDTSVGRGVRRAVRYLWRRIRQQQDDQQQDDAQDGGQDGHDGTGQAGKAVSRRRRGWGLPFRRRPALIPGFGNFNPQVSGQGAWQGGRQGPWQGPPVGAPGWGPGAWPAGQVTMPLPGPVPAWGTAPLGQAPADAWPHPANTWTTGPVPTGPVPVQPVTQPAAGVYRSGQGQGVRLDPVPQYLAPQATGPGIGAGGERIQERRAAVARALPRLRVTPHGDRGRVVADLAADWGVDPRTIHNDIEALTSGQVAR